MMDFKMIAVGKGKIAAQVPRLVALSRLSPQSSITPNIRFSFAIAGISLVKVLMAIDQKLFRS